MFIVCVLGWEIDFRCILFSDKSPNFSLVIMCPNIPDGRMTRTFGSLQNEKKEKYGDDDSQLGAKVRGFFVGVYSMCIVCIFVWGVDF